MVHAASTVLASLALAATSVSASSLFFPFYVYPNKEWLDGCSNWQSVFSSIAEHPDLHYLFVINPNSGPGDGDQPDENYQQCIPMLLQAGSNVETIAYVKTGWGTRPSSEVEAEIATYAQWSEVYRPSGIFFDEAARTSEFVDLYAGYSQTVKDSLGGKVVFNPGTLVADDRYFSSADLIVTAEYAYGEFDISTDFPTSAAAPAEKQVVVLHTGPSTTDASLVEALSNLGAGGIFLTDYNINDAYSYVPSDWQGLVDAMDNSA